MITLLAKIFISKDMDEVSKRERYGMLCGTVGIFLNIMLFVFKFCAGLLSGAISITADAFNNLSDAASSVVTLVGFKLAGNKADSEHPFGHGRVEYVAGLTVSAIILIMAFELIKDSVSKIIHPKSTEFSLLIGIILGISILVKLYMAAYNSGVSRKIGSATVRAAAIDSLSDVVTTSVVLVAMLIQHYTGWQIDGYFGVLVGFMVFYAGFSAGKDTLNPLLGMPPSAEFVGKVQEIATHFDENIVGIHDLVVHDYGPGRVFISIHAEVPEDGSLVELHEIIDRLENRLEEELGCVATIHMDPIATKDEHVMEIKSVLKHILREIGEDISMHDFRVVKGETNHKLVFDVVLPFSSQITDVQLKEQLEKQVHERIGEEYDIIIRVDRASVL